MRVCEGEVLTVFPECYKVLEQTSIPLGNYMYEEVPILPFCHFDAPFVHLLLHQYHRHPWHHLSSGYKATLAQLKSVVSTLNWFAEFWTGFTHSNKAVNFFSLHPFSSHYFCFFPTMFLYIHIVELSFTTMTPKQITILKWLLQFLEIMFKPEEWIFGWKKIH